jgi:hypothetical protein
MRARYDRITTTIEREWLAEIIAGTKKIEYRRIKPYWTKRFAKVSVPFELRLLNGMNPPVLEVTVLKIAAEAGIDPTAVGFTSSEPQARHRERQAYMGVRQDVRLAAAVEGVWRLREIDFKRKN